MGDVSEFKPGWSIARLADEFGMARATVAKRIREAGVAPAGKRNAHDVYALADVVPALVDPLAKAFAGVVDPRDLPPMERRAYYQSENERLKSEMTVGTLVHAAEVESELAQLVKTVTQFLETLPEVMERNCALRPEQVLKVQATCDSLRERMYEAIVSDDETEGHAQSS